MRTLEEFMPKLSTICQAEEEEEVKEWIIKEDDETRAEDVKWYWEAANRYGWNPEADSDQEQEEEEQGEWKVAESRSRRRKRNRMARRNSEQLGLGRLETILPEGVNSIGVNGEWEEIEMAVDSGASETVVNEDMIGTVEVVEGEASKRGVKYEVATGVQIPNLGEKRFEAESEEGVRRSITAQVCDVNKALLSVHRVKKAGNRVVFEDDEQGNDASYIECRETGEKMWMRENKGMYMLKLWVRKARF